MNKNILSYIKNELKNNKNELKKISEIDKKYNPNTFDLDTYIELIDLYNSNNYEVEGNKSIGVVYFGNIEFTLCISIFAIMNNIKLTLFIQDYSVGINECIVSIINNILKEYRIKNEIKIYNMCSWKKMQEQANNFDKLICFGDENSYNILKNMNIKNLVNFKYNISIFKDSSEFNEISSKIIDLSYDFGIEVQVFDDIETLLQYSDNYYILIFSRNLNEEKIKELNNKLNYKKLFINENPFSKIKIDYELINDVFGTCPKKH